MFLFLGRCIHDAERCIHSLDKYWSIFVLIITISSRFHQYFPNKGREQIKREAEKVNEMEEERK